MVLRSIFWMWNWFEVWVLVMRILVLGFWFWLREMGVNFFDIFMLVVYFSKVVVGLFFGDNIKISGYDVLEFW